MLLIYCFSCDFSEKLFKNMISPFQFLKLYKIYSPDAVMVESILDEIREYSKKAILKVKKNLDFLYGAHSNEKKNQFNKLHTLLKNQITVS